MSLKELQKLFENGSMEEYYPSVMKEYLPKFQETVKGKNTTINTGSIEVALNMFALGYELAKSESK